jgi:hypothetical protein
MALATRVACNKESNGYGSKSDSNGNKGGGQATAMRAMTTEMAKTWAMATATKVAGNEKSNGKGGKGDGNGDEGGG